MAALPVQSSARFPGAGRTLVVDSDRLLAPQRNISAVEPLSDKAANASNDGLLLALDGRCMDRLALPHALQLCKRRGGRLDILLLNPPKPATFVLGAFLQQLEAANIDYRLSSGEGNLAHELPLYLHRFRYISCVVLDCLDKWETRQQPMLHALRQEGYQVLTLLDGQGKVTLSSAERKDMP